MEKAVKDAYNAKRDEVVANNSGIQVIQAGGRIPDKLQDGTHEVKLLTYPEFTPLGQKDSNGAYNWAADMVKVKAGDFSFRVMTDFDEFSESSLKPKSTVKVEIYSYETENRKGETVTRRGGRLLI